MTVQAAYHAFYQHTATCVTCERARPKHRATQRPESFQVWHKLACPAGRELLERWKAACSEHLLERAPLDMGRIA